MNLSATCCAASLFKIVRQTQCAPPQPHGGADPRDADRWLALYAVGSAGEAEIVVPADRPLKSVRVPTLVVVGQYDYVCSKAARLLAQTIPNASLKIIADSGHMSPLEQTRRVQRRADGISWTDLSRPAA